MVVLSIIGAIGGVMALALWGGGAPVLYSLAGRLAMAVLLGVAMVYVVAQLAGVRRSHAPHVARRQGADPARPILSADGQLAFAPSGRSGESQETYGA